MKEDLVYNASYNHKGLAMTVGMIAEAVKVQADWMSAFSQAMTDNSPYAIDHAAEHLESLALQLTALADRARGLVQYTNYPPVKPVSHDCQNESITNA